MTTTAENTQTGETAEAMPAVKWEKGLDLSQCEHKTEKGRRCKLVVHDDTIGHKYMFRNEIPAPPHITKVAPEGFTLQMERIPAGADLGISRTRALDPRDEHQVRVDKDSVRAYNAWDKAGKPKGKFEDLAVKYGGRYIVPPAAFDTVIDMLIRVKKSGGPLAGKRLQYRKGTHESGATIINFMFTDPDPKTTAENDGQ
jgi:hypothetical protein